jgi:hypothetical protein
MQTNAQEIVDNLLEDKAPVREADDLFVSHITDTNAVDFTSASDSAELVERADIQIHWSLEPEYRAWGVKDIGLQVITVNGSVQLEGFEEVPGQEEGRDIERGVSVTGWKISSRVNPREGGNFSLYPTGVELDETQRTCVVVF